MDRNTGRRTLPHVWRQAQARKAVLDAQTERLADALEGHGVAARASREAATMIGDITGCAETPETYRAIRFLPIVAQRERAPMLNALRYFQATTEIGPHLRLAVITAGARLAFGGPLRGTIQQLQRRVSKWAKATRDRYRIELVFRGTEFTVDAEKTLHPHVNVLYAPLRRLQAPEWSAFLTWSHDRLGAHWRDCGRLAKPDEAIKYPFKPADLDRLDATDYAWLYAELARLKLIQPLGAFAAFWRELDAARQKIALVADGETFRLARVCRQPREARPPSSRPEAEPENQLIARTAPVPRFCPYWEPCSLVRNYTEAPRTEGGRLRLQQLRDHGQSMREAWTRNGAPDPAEALAQGRGNVADDDSGL